MRHGFIGVARLRDPHGWALSLWRCRCVIALIDHFDLVGSAAARIFGFHTNGVAALAEADVGFQAFGECETFVGAIDQQADVAAVGDVSQLCDDLYVVAVGGRRSAARLYDAHLGSLRHRRLGRRPRRWRDGRSGCVPVFEYDNNRFFVAACRVGGHDPCFIASGTQAQVGGESAFIKRKRLVAAVQVALHVGVGMYVLDAGTQVFVGITRHVRTGSGVDDFYTRGGQAFFLSGDVPAEMHIRVVLPVVVAGERVVVGPALTVEDIGATERDFVTDADDKTRRYLVAQFDTRSGHKSCFQRFVRKSVGRAFVRAVAQVIQIC